MANGEPSAVGGFSSGSQNSAPKGKRAIADLIDLLAVPILLGVVAGLILIAVPDGIRNVLLIIINIAWLVFRDAFFSPGRKMVNLKLISADGNKVSLAQAFIRNILIMIPFVLVIGYIVEIVFVDRKSVV